MKKNEKLSILKEDLGKFKIDNLENVKGGNIPPDVGCTSCTTCSPGCSPGNKAVI